MSNSRHIRSQKDFKKKPSAKKRLHDNVRGGSKKLSLKRLTYNQQQRREQLALLAQYGINLAVIAAVIGLSIIFILTSRDLPDPNQLLERNIEQTTTIYDREEETILYQLHGDVNRKIVQLDELPEYMKQATLTAEDRNFYEHKGFSLTGIARSIIVNLTSGSRVGGSTITQQFVKNAILTTEKTYTRKLKELILAYRIEQKFSKDEILQLYFNEIPYGSVIYGVEAASQSYFGISARDLTLGQAAILAALPQRPTYFSPYGTNIDRLMERQQWILDNMVELGYIEQAAADAAKAEEITFKPRQESLLAPHFVMYIRQLLADEYGERYAEEAGLKVVTTLDMEHQTAAEQAIADHIEKNRDSYNASNASLVAMDTKTGQITAMVGSADFYDEEIDGQVNVALRPRQPGSSFKPLAYAVAFEKGFTPETVLYDVVTDFGAGGQSYTPQNYNLAENGPVTMRKALAGSLNIPAVKALYLAGVDRVLNTAEKLGYTTLRDRSRFGLSLVLGGGEVLLLEHTAAYAAFAREGQYHSPLAILKIEDADGEVLYEYKEGDNRGKQVMDAQAVRSLNSVLSDNAARAYTFGEQNNLTLGGRPVAAKTGTTNDYRDAWTMGYTPSLAAGVWAGNNDNSAMRNAGGSLAAAPIWNQFMRAVLADQPVETFQPAPENTAEKPVLRGELAGLTPTRIDSITGKLATEDTPEELVIEKVFTQFHSILYYINKDDPRGPAPQDPFSDPQFPRWEDAVRAWAEAQGYTENEEAPPTEYDDVHTPANRPSLTIFSPQNGDTITGTDFSVDISAGAPRGVSRVVYAIDGQEIATVTDSPYGLNTTLNNLSSGIHTLTVSVYDDVSNVTRQSLDLNFLVPDAIAPVTFSWRNLSDGGSYAVSDFPLTITGDLTATHKVESINLTAAYEGGSPSLITKVSSPSSSLSVDWLLTNGAGSYNLYALIFQTNGQIVRTSDITVTVTE